MKESLLSGSWINEKNAVHIEAGVMNGILYKYKLE